MCNKMYKIKFVNSAPTKEQFNEWDIQKGSPKFYLEIYIYENTKKIIYFKIEYKGNYDITSGYLTENKKVIEQDLGNYGENKFEYIIQQILMDEDYQNEFNKNVGNSMLDECHIGLLEYLDGYSHY